MITMAVTHARRGQHQKGVALVLVLWLLALFTIMAGGYTATMRTETLLAAQHLHSSQARALSEAGIWYGIKELTKPQSEQAWNLDGSPHNVEFHDDEFEVRLYDETGKIDLNTARVELLHNLLLTTELEEGEALRLLHAILDWRDRDNLKRNFGAEDDDYEAADMEYGAKDGPFNSVGEVRMVMGMTEAVYQRIAPALTVHSHQPAINPEVAPREALLALPETDPDAVEEFLVAREQGMGSQSFFPGDGNRFSSRTRGRTITVAGTGKAGDSTFTTKAVVLLKPNASPPFAILSWRESLAAP